MITGLVVRTFKWYQYQWGTSSITSGGASIEGARAPPLLKFWDEKKMKKKNI